MTKELDLNNILIIGGVALGGYAIYRFFNYTEKTTDAIGNTAAGVGQNVTTATGAVSGVLTDTEDAYSDILTVTNPLKEFNTGAAELIKTGMSKVNDVLKGSATTKQTAASLQAANEAGIRGNAAISSLILPNLAINPTAQSFYTQEMADAGYHEAPLSVQNTVSLANKFTSVAKALSTSKPYGGTVVPKTQSIAFKKGYIK